MPLGLSQSTSLLLLFVVLPFAVGAVVMSLIGRRSAEPPPGTRTSELLDRGDPSEGEIVDRRVTGGFLDTRPMVHFLLQVRTPEGDEIRVVATQSIPRRALPSLLPGRIVTVHLSVDRSVAAIEIPS